MAARGPAAGLNALKLIVVLAAAAADMAAVNRLKPKGCIDI
jgi:hypothetical protein